MSKTIYILLLYLSIKGCQSQEVRNYVVDLIDDNCIESHHRLELRRIDNDSIYQVISLKEIDNKEEIKVGDTLKIMIRKIEREDWDLKPNMRQERYVFYCDGIKILEEEEYFYKSENLKGLRLVD